MVGGRESTLTGQEKELFLYSHGDIDLSSSCWRMKKNGTLVYESSSKVVASLSKLVSHSDLGEINVS